jgi:ABC-type uncharacterized transport system permease subunit
MGIGGFVLLRPVHLQYTITWNTYACVMCARVCLGGGMRMRALRAYK